MAKCFTLSRSVADPVRRLQPRQMWGLGLRPHSDPSAECGLPADGVGLFATHGFHGCLGTHRLLGLAIHSFSFSGSCVTRHSVVSSNPAIEAAFCRAARLTFVGSTTPALTRSSYSSVATL